MLEDHGRDDHVKMIVGKASKKLLDGSASHREPAPACRVSRIGIQLDSLRRVPPLAPKVGQKVAAARTDLQQAPVTDVMRDEPKTGELRR